MAIDLEMIRKHIEYNDDGYTLVIPVNDFANGVTVTEITMFVSADGDSDGDLAVNWDASKLQNNGGGDMGPLAMRGWDDEVGKVMGFFYWDAGYNNRLHAHLVAAGFTASAAYNVSGSEWGMQDEGRASYDAYDIADEVRAAVK